MRLVTHRDPDPLPPGPRWPSGVQTLALGFAEDRYLAHCRRRYGSVWTERLAGLGTTVVVTDPRLARAVLTAPGEVLHGGQGRAELGVALGPRSLILLDGPEHLSARRLLLPPLHGERLRGQAAALADVIETAIDAWAPGPRAPVLAVTKDIAVDAVLRVVFGVTDAAERARRGATARRVLDLANSTRVTAATLARRYGTLRLVPDYHAALRALDAWVAEEVAGRPSGPRAAGTVLEMLREARTADGEGLAPDAIRDQVVTLLLAGYETTAATLAWAIDLLVHHPAALRRLEAEVLEGDGEHEWTDAVLEETLRLRPPVRFVGRTVVAPFALGEHELPVGTRIVVVFGEMHRDAERWDGAAAFRPERFEASPPAWSYLPFGGGARRCVGASFSMLEMRLALQALVRRFAFSVAGPPSQVERRGVFYLPKTGVVVGCAPRRRAEVACPA